MGTQKAWVSAIISAIIAFLTAMLTAVQGQDVGFESITMSQWLTAIIAFLVAFGGAGGVTFRVPNSGTRPGDFPPPPPRDEPEATPVEAAPARQIR